METSVPSYWHYIAIGALLFWAAVFRLRLTWRSHIAVFLVMAWAATLFSWSVAMDPGLGTVSGKVVDGRRATPIERARVYFPGEEAFVRTRPDGTFSMPGVRVGKSVRISVRARGYESSYDEVAVTEGHDTQDMLFRMSAKVPSFNLYNSERVFPPGEEPSIHFSGQLVERVRVRVFPARVDEDRLDVASGTAREALAARLEARTQPVWETTWRTPLDADGDFDGTLKLPISQPGLYIVRAKAEKGSVARTTWLQITDLAVVTRRSPHEILVYAQEFGSGRPAAGARLAFYSGSSKVQQGVTGADGTWSWKEPGYGSLQVVAARGAHRAWSHLDRFSPSEVTRGWRVYVYTERPIYRPSHEVFFRGIVRRDRDRVYSVPRGQSVRVTATDPAGNHVFDRTVTTDPFGCFSSHLRLPPQAALGSYTLEARVESVTGQADFKVAEYRKPEFRVELKPEKHRYISGETVRMRVDSRYFFGAPVTSGRVRYMVYESYYRWEGVQFRDVDGDSSPEHYGGLVAEGKLKTDAQGVAWIEFTSGRGDHDRDFWVSVEVEDPSHRVVTANTDVLVTLGDFYLDAFTDRYGYNPGDTVDVRVTALDYDHKPRAGLSVAATLVHREYVEKTDRQGVTRMEASEKPVWTGEATTGSRGDTVFAVRPPGEGLYIMTVSSRDGAGNDIHDTRWFFVSAGDRGFAFSSRDLSVLLDRPKYRAGEQVKALISTAAPEGYVLLTVDGRRIHSAQVVHVTRRSATVTLPVKPEYFPNVMVTATMVYHKQLLTDEKPLVIQAGARNLRISIRPDRKTYRPGDEVRCQVHIADASGRPVRASFSAGVVDAAIYALATDTTAAIYDYFYGLESSQVRTEYSFSPDYSGGRSKDDDEGRIRRNFKDTAWWGPSLVTGADGNAAFSFRLPDNLTTWRFTLRAISQDSLVGEATQEILVRKPLLVRLEVPRFIVRGDRMEWSAVIHNETGQAQTVDAEMRVDGVTLESTPAQKVQIPNGESQRCAWTVEATKVGEARATVTARGRGAKDAMELKVPILSDAIGHLDTRAGQATPTSRFIVKVPAQAEPRESRVTLYLSPSVASAAMQGLDYLATYPYGCTEQTMSAFLPDIQLSRALKGLHMESEYTAVRQKLPEMVSRGLSRLYDGQHADGGWGWWKDDATHPYLTAYVVHGLHQAQMEGYAVRGPAYQRSVAALEKMVKEDTSEFRDASGEVRQRTRWNARAYMIWVLVEAGKRPLVEARETATHDDTLNAYTRALLAQSLWKLGDRDKATALLDEVMREADETATSCHWDTRTVDYSWVENPVEATAAVLSTLLVARPTDARIDKIVRWLVDYRKGNRWTSTRDTGAVIGVLTDYLLQRTSERRPDFRARVRINGHRVADLPVKSLSLGLAGVIQVPPAFLREGDNTVEIEQVGKGTLYWSLQAWTWPRSESAQAEDHGFAITRAYGLVTVKTGSDGKPVMTETPLPAGAAVPLGSRVRVHVRVTHQKPYPYVMIEDRLPPGFELSIPEAERNQGGGWYVGQEVHDDTLSVFATRLEAGTHELVYELFAEAGGRYQVRPAQAYLMYTPEVRGHSAPSRLDVNGEETP